MRKYRTFILLFVYSVATLFNLAESKENSQTQDKADIPIEKLGEDLYKIGKIIVNKKQKTLEIPGKILRKEPPVEFLAVARNGSRGYESLLELEVDVFEFNLACILIGLEKNKGQSPAFHFDPTPVEGSAVEIILKWEVNRERKQLALADVFQFEDTTLTRREWVYTGSMFLPNGDYLADAEGGTLVGFVHDPASIIEHRSGFMAESYSKLKLNMELLPSLDTPITVKFISR